MTQQQGSAPPLSSPDALAREILQGLAEGRFVPGQKLVERDLMERYGLGRSSVREGLGRLVSTGVVEVIAHRGAMIRRLDAKEAANVLRVCQALMGLTCRQAAEAVAAGADPAPLAAAAEAYDTATGPEVSAARARYYRQLTLLAGNHELTRLLPSMQIPLVRAQLPPPESDGHGELVRPILEGNPDAAEAAARQHVGRLLEVLPLMHQPTLLRK